MLALSCFETARVHVANDGDTLAKRRKKQGDKPQEEKALPLQLMGKQDVLEADVEKFMKSIDVAGTQYFKLKKEVTFHMLAFCVRF